MKSLLKLAFSFLILVPPLPRTPMPPRTTSTIPAPIHSFVQYDLPAQTATPTPDYNQSLHHRMPNLHASYEQLSVTMTRGL